MPGRSFALVLLTTFASFGAFYAPQPLLPFFAAEFDVAPATAALLLTVTFVFLAVAPLGFGVVLQRFSAQRLLVGASALLGLLQIAFALAPNFATLMVVRTLQGILYPAIFTAAVTYCSKSAAGGAVAGRVSIYVATTIVGGLSGRLIGGFVSSWLDWRASFVLLGVLLLGCSFGLLVAARDSSLPGASRSLAAARELLATRGFAAGLALIFIVFFTFSACLNALPFRLTDLEPDIPAARISMVYIGYLIGVAIALRIGPITRFLGGPVRTMRVALATFVVGLVLMWTPDATALIAIGFLTSAGMFTVHTTLSGYLNGLHPEHASLVNGIYISVYYSAGATGSVLPLWLYHHLGWSAFLAAMLAACVAGFVPLALLSGPGGGGRRGAGGDADARHGTG